MTGHYSINLKSCFANKPFLAGAAYFFVFLSVIIATIKAPNASINVIVSNTVMAFPPFGSPAKHRPRFACMYYIKNMGKSQRKIGIDMLP